MSSSFMNYNEEVNISNMMFWRVHKYALDIAEQKNDLTADVIQKFSQIESNMGSTPDVDIDKYFTKEELQLWSNIFNELADKIFNREIGNQENQEWQVWTIWAACSISKLFNNSLRYLNSQTH